MYPFVLPSDPNIPHVICPAGQQLPNNSASLSKPCHMTVHLLYDDVVSLLFAFVWKRRLLKFLDQDEVVQDILGSTDSGLSPGFLV